MFENEGLSRHFSLSAALFDERTTGNGQNLTKAAGDILGSL